MINSAKKNIQNFQAFGTQILKPLIPKQNDLKPEVCEKRKFVPIKKQLNNLNIQHKLQPQEKIVSEKVIKEKQTICYKSKQSKKKLIKKPQPKQELQREQSIQIKQEEDIPEVSKPLTYVIIRTVKIKEVKGEVIINFNDQACCLQIRNRLLNFDDVKQKFPNINNISEMILIEIDTNQVMKKNHCGWVDCRDCEEYLIK